MNREVAGFYIEQPITRETQHILIVCVPGYTVGIRLLVKYKEEWL